MPLKASEARSKQPLADAAQVTSGNKKLFQYAKKSAPGFTGGVIKPKPKSAGLRLPVKRSASGFDGGVTKN